MAIDMCRAKRQTLDSARGTTQDIVAPGSYDVPTNSIKIEGERSVPFASGVDKVCCPNTTTSGYTPGPGHYVGQGIANDAPNGLGPITFKSKAARIGPTAPGSSIYCESTVHKNPGPGTYATKTDWELALKKPSRSAANPWTEERTKTVPSIPLQKLPPNAKPENSMGQDITNMSMRHTGETKDTVGPGEYDPMVTLTSRSQPQTSFTGGTKKDRKIWEATGSIDSRLPPADNPGPGAYDTTRGLSDSAADGSDKSGTYQFASKTQLGHQKERGQVRPGPGQYEAPGQIEKLSARARAHSQAHGDRTRFGSVVQRVGWTRPIDMPFVDPYHVHHVPGPGSYPTTGGTFPAADKEKEKEAKTVVPGSRKKKFYGVHHPMIVMALQETQGPLEAFGSTDDRSCNKVQLQTTPAPWSYNKEEARGKSMASELREKKKIGRNGAFGSLADRFAGSPLYGRDDLPELGLDSEMSGGGMGGGGSNSEPRSMFNSQTPRMQGSPSGEIHAVTVGLSEVPGPGAYYVENEISYRSPFRRPRTDHLSFASGQDRFDIGRDVFDAHGIQPYGQPAPGDYHCRNPGPAQNGAVVVKDKRQMTMPVGSTTVDVGPGSYGSIDTPMLKKTFNVSTQAPVSHLGGKRNASERRDVGDVVGF